MNPEALSLLVVDDHPAQRRLIVEMLRRLGVSQISEARSGSEAIELIGSGAAFDAVLTDLDMPSGDGLDLARRVRALGLSLPVSLMSAMPGRILEGIETLRGDGSRLIHRVLHKPVGLAALRQWLDTLEHPQAAPPVGPHYTLDQMAAAVTAGQIRPWFEPQVNLIDGRLCGFEALARWHHPVDGLVNPGRFVPALEGTPVLKALTLSILEQVLQALRDWRAAGPALRVSLNVGMGCLEDPDFAVQAWQHLLAMGVEPRRVTLEVTETASMNDAEAVVATLARLRMRGFELAVDDFGTGYASLKQFSYGEYSEVKVDRHFVSRVLEDRTARAATASIAVLARELDMRCVAEGIESPAVLAEVRRLGCSVGQGWLWSQPLAAEQVDGWIRGFAAREPAPYDDGNPPSQSPPAREQKL